jgi:hypothetical protein
MNETEGSNGAENGNDPFGEYLGSMEDLQNSEQAQAATEQIAQTIAVFYNALLSAGVPANVSGIITGYFATFNLQIMREVATAQIRKGNG